MIFSSFEPSRVRANNKNKFVFHFRRAAFLTQLKSKVGLALTKAAALRINLNLDGAPTRLLISSLSLGVPVPRPTQCVRDA
jgi:hypothetical protein